jgi:hypothetical protein
MKKLMILPFIMLLNACTITKPDSHDYTYIYQHNSNNKNSNNTQPTNTEAFNSRNSETDYSFSYNTPPPPQVHKRKNNEETLYTQDDENFLKSKVIEKDNQGIPKGYYSGWGYVTVPKTERLSDGRVIHHNHYYPAEAFGIGVRQ